MAGLIRDDDIAVVRERARIDEVVSGYVTLKHAGGGSQKGLCPFHDEKSPSFNVNPSKNFFHCLAGETEVMTWEGVRPIRELAGGVHRVLGASAQWVEAPFASYGVQPLHRITVSRGRVTKEILATDGHRWFVRTGTSPQGRREELTSGLEPGDELASVYPRSRVGATTPSPFGIAHGFTFGAGALDGDGSVALLCPPQDEAMLKWFPNSVTSASGHDLLVHHLPRFFTAPPDLGESASYLLGWLAGYVAAAGSVASDGTVVLDPSTPQMRDLVRTLCTRLGIGTSVLTGQTGLHLDRHDLAEDFFLVSEHRDRFGSAATGVARPGWVVRSVEPTDRVEEVFCAEVRDGHAFALADNLLTGNCFGCGEGGDVISFLMKIDGIGFSEAVERLADKYGVQLRYQEGAGERPAKREHNLRPRMLEAHKAAQAYYADQLTTPAAQEAREFLTSRGFDKDAAATFGVGFAPRGGDDLFKHLRQKGFADVELVTGGLVAQGNRGHYDRFRGRLLWPIRETNGDVIGFGARRIFDDDRIEAKYLNTPETPIYKKSHVLYGIDLARRDIARASQAVVVEGYTDVMACHLAGVPTAVATCGTAFGEDHGRVLRRLLQDHDEFRGEVIFTFDGDAAGQKAALRAFEGDQNFAGQTYVAVDPDGLDPCDVRLQQGDAAVRELVARRIPLYRFVLGNVVGRYDLDRADGRVDALREAAKLVSAIRDRSKVEAFSRELAGMVGVDIDDARAEVRRAANRRPADRPTRPSEAAPDRAAAPPLPDLRDPRFSLERETLKLVVQHPEAVGRMAKEVDGDDFTHPTYRGVWDTVVLCGGPASAPGGEVWVSKLRDSVVDPAVAQALSALAVEPLLSSKEPTSGYVAAHVFRLQEVTALRRITDLKSRLQRTNPVERATEYNRMFGELVALEQHRRTLREKAIGGDV